MPKDIFLIKILFVIKNNNKKVKSELNLNRFSILNSFIFLPYWNLKIVSFNKNLTLSRDIFKHSNTSIIINNYIKLTSLSFQKDTHQGLFFLNFFIINNLKNKIDKNIFMEINNYYIKEKVSFYSFLKLIKNKFKKMFTIKRLKISYTELIWVFFLLFKTKDITFFKNWLKNKFLCTRLKLRKNLISLIKYSVKVLLINYLSYFSLLGFYFRVKGKISSSGSSKKRMLKFGIGKMSRNTKPLKIGISELNIKTSSGMIGINISILY